jgi:hypothetical protein
MKKSRILFTVIVAGLGTLLASCGSDDVRTLNPTETKQAFQNANAKLATDLSNLNSSSGYSAMNSLSVLTSTSNPFGRIKTTKSRGEVRDHLKAGIHSFRLKLLATSSTSGRVSETEPFDYNSKKGVYEWDFETETFKKTGTSTIIKILFPTEGSNTNNAEFQLTAYQEVATTYGYEPTIVKAIIKVDGVKEAELDLKVDYRNDGEPKFADIFYFVNPFSIDVNYNDTKSTSTTFSETLSKNGTVLIGVGASVTYYSASKEDGNIKSASSYIQLVNIKFTIKANNSGSANTINDLIVITITINGNKAGKVIFEQDELTGELIPYVKYTDGTTELLEDLFEDLAFELGDLFG